MDIPAYIVGAYEHPKRLLPDRTVAEIHSEVIAGALADAGLSLKDVDGYFCAGDVPGMGPLSMLEYLNITPRYVDSTDLGGCAYIAHVMRAADAISRGDCSIALISLGGRPKSDQARVGSAGRIYTEANPEAGWETPFSPSLMAGYAMAAQRHMHDYGTTMEQLAGVKVAMSMHAQHNPHAKLPKLVTLDEVMASDVVASPLRRLDCCVVTDGGGALIVAKPEVARTLKRPLIAVRGGAIGFKHQSGGAVDLTYTAAAQSGPAAFAKAGVTPADIRYASVYDSFTITVLLQLEDLGFCPKGEGGKFVQDAALAFGNGPLTVNTDGGGLCSNHPSNRGGMTKVIEAVRQLRQEANPAVQLQDLTLALVTGIGGNIGNRHASATLILERM